MTEQAEITVKFRIIELLSIYDELIIAHDHGDDEAKKVCVYLCKRIWNQIPEFEESKNFPKLFIPK